MDENGSRIRRRVSYRKRARPSLESIGAVCTAADHEPEPENVDEEEMVAGGRRRKTLDPQPVEYDSEEDMFGDYDSFAENSLLDQIDDLEQKYIQLPEQKKQDTDPATKVLSSGHIEDNKLSFPVVGDSATLKDNEHATSLSEPKDATVESEMDLLYDVPSSQVLYFENLQNPSNNLSDHFNKERDGNSSSRQASNEALSHSRTELPQQNDKSFSKVQTSADVTRRRSLKDHLKSAMTGNAKAQTPVFSKTKQLQETLISEEINVAKKALETPSDDRGPFYSLPSKVKDLYVQFKGIEKLYGNVCCNEKEISSVNMLMRIKGKEIRPWSFQT